MDTTGASAKTASQDHLPPGEFYFDALLAKACVSCITIKALLIVYCKVGYFSVRPKALTLNYQNSCDPNVSVFFSASEMKTEKKAFIQFRKKKTRFGL